MTFVAAEGVALVLLPFCFAAGALGYHWHKTRSKADEPMAAPPVLSQRLPKRVNRQAAQSAVLRRQWADTDRQTVPRQLSPAERPVGAHRTRH